mmetsp:Transcript_17565/g.47877  ORF Transcript_17565/g.47877 Transcript_17565/m.47877 type:complete len:998 (-) Transcript_17565:693-3686(-)
MQQHGLMKSCAVSISRVLTRGSHYCGGRNHSVSITSRSIACFAQSRLHATFQRDAAKSHACVRRTKYDHSKRCLCSMNGHRIGGLSAEVDEDTLERWIQLRNRLLLSTEQVGDDSIDDALALAQCMQEHPSLARDRERMKDIFAVLDHLSEGHWLPNASRSNLLHLVMLAWSEYIESENSGSLPQGRHEEELGPFDVLQKLRNYFESGLFERSAHPFDLILSVMDMVYTPQTAPYKGHAIYQLILQQKLHDPMQQAFPEESTVYQIVNLWSKSGLPEAAERAENYLDELKQFIYPPSAHILCATMEAYARDSDTSRSISRIGELFEEMKTSCKHVNALSYIRVCHALARSSHPDSVDQANSVLEEMIYLYEQNDETMKPTPLVYSAVIAAYGRTGKVAKAAALFEYMAQLAENKGDPDLRPSKVSYQALIWAHARAGNAREVELLLPQMMTSLHDEDVDDKLIEDIVAAVLVAWSRAGDENAVENIALIVQQLQKHTGDERLALRSYNALLSCYARQQNSALGAKVADDLLRWLEHQEGEDIHPDASSYLNVMLAWKGAGNPTRCESTLRHLLKKVKDGAIEEGSFGRSHFNVAIAAWAQSDLPKAPNKALTLLGRMRKYGVSPDTVSYNSVIHALGRSKNTNIDALKEAMRLFSQMIVQWKAGDTSSIPDDITFNSILVACAHSPNDDAIPIMESLVGQMESLGIRLNRIMYTSIMTAWAKRQQPQRVEEIFQEMKSEFEGGDASCKPHRHSYVTRLRGWVRAGNVKMTIQVLNEMNVDLQQDLSIRDLNAILEAWLYSGDGKAAEKADCCLHYIFPDVMGDFLPTEHLSESEVESLISGLEISKLKWSKGLPDVFSFTLVLSNYTRSDSSAASYRAYYLLEKLKSLATEYGKPSLQPTAKTYLEVVDVLFNSGDPHAGRVIFSLLKELETKDDDVWQVGENAAASQCKNRLDMTQRTLENVNLVHKAEIKQVLKKLRERLCGIRFRRNDARAPRK